MQNTVNAVLILCGLGLQIAGLIITYFSVRKIIFPQITASQSVLSHSIELSDNKPIDEKSKKPVNIATIPEPRKTRIGVSLIIAGLVLQTITIIIDYLLINN